MGKHEPWFSLAEIEGLDGANAQGVVSLVREVDPINPMAWFDAGGLAGFSRRQFWRNAEDRLTLVGLGAAFCLEGALSASVELQTQWSCEVGRYADEATPFATGAVALGGFRFADHHGDETNGIWTEWPSGQLVVPQWLLTVRGERAWITLNQGRLQRVTKVRGPRNQVFEQEQALYSLVSRMPGMGDDVRDRPEIWVGSVDRELWTKSVDQVAEDIRRQQLVKVVLARVLEARSTKNWDLSRVVSGLGKNQAGTYRFAIVNRDQTFLGATPERLVDYHDGHIATMCLAGSAPRGDTPALDERLGADLLTDAKNLYEHKIVVDQVSRIVRELGQGVEISQPELVRWPDIQHLRTTIRAAVDKSVSILSLVARLHPTPAVLGLPEQAAWAEIRRHEKFDRGWYAGPIGWMDAHGQGEFAVALRSALLARNQAWLFAGAGLVGQSEGESEFQETTWKFNAMLNALGEVQNG